MSPRDQAAAVKLIGRWLLLCEEILGRDPDPAEAEKMLGQLVDLQRDSRAFIKHEDPHA